MATERFYLLGKIYRRTIMAFLVANIPPVKCFVRKEFLYNNEKGHGELEPCVWMTAKAIKGQAFRIEALLPNYGALYDKLPLHAFVTRQTNLQNATLPLDYLQIWDALSYNITVIEKDNLRMLKCKFLDKDICLQLTFAKTTLVI